ncbi:MAG: PAS domain S-box protein [Paludibacter sp.]|nr:PAS domain S-box protein [Paludibacter sp.]
MNTPNEINKITLYSKHKHLIHFIIGVFFLEFCTMLAMDFLPPLPLITKSLIDSFSLMIILFPVVYFLVIRPENKYNLERECANDALKESELKFRKYIDFAPHGVFVANENGEYVEVNAAASTITGFSKEELLSMKIMDTVPEESIEGALNHFNKVVSEGYASDELSFTRKDNSKGHWSVDAVKLSNNLFLGFVTDISERKKAEKKLSESEELFRTLAGNIPQLCWMTNAEGYIFWYNQRWYDYTGTTPEQMEGWGWKSVHHPDHVDHVIESWTSALKDQEPWEDTFPLRSASGEYGWFLSRAFPIRNEKGEIVRWFGTNTDITKRLKTEESLAQAKEEWECTFNAIPDLIAIIDSNHKIVRANKAMAERMGLNENKCGEVECFKAIHNMDHVPAFCPHSQTVQDGCLHEVEIFEQQLNGDFIVTTTPLMNPNGELMGSVHVAHDITNRKKMEDLLRESEERYKSIFVKSLSVMMLIDPDTAEIKDVNQAACDYYGWSNDEFLTKYISDINLIPRGKVISSMQNAKNEVQNHFIFKHRMATGELRDVEVYSCPLEFNGKVALFSIIHDITESKKLEEALRESEYFFRESQRAGFIGSYKTDFVKNSWESSEVLDQIFGIERNYFKDFNSFLDIIHPDDRMEIRLFMTDETLSKGIEFNHEFKIIRKNDEETRWVHGLGKIGYDENHNVISLVGTIQDITDRKKSEKALRESDESVRLKLQSILSPDGSIADLELNDIIDAPAIQKLMDSFYELTEVPMAIIDIKGKVLVGIGWQDICTKFHRVHPKACSNCFESDIHLTKGIPDGEFKLYKCKNNMWDMATPIIIGGEHKGNLYMGQFFFDNEPIDNTLFLKQADEYGFDKKEYLKALQKVPRLSKNKIDHSKTFFLNLSSSISQLSYSNIKLAKAIIQQKQVEETLREKDELLNKAHEIAHLGSWSLDIISNELIWSDEIYRIFGLELQQFPATYEGFLNAVHPDDREAVDLAFTNSIKEGNDSYEIEHRIVRKDTGELRYVYEKCEHIKDPSGKIIKSIGMVHDITERIVKEKTLRKLNQTLLALSKTNLAMSQLEDETEYLKQACNIVVEDTDFSMVWIGYAENDEAKTIRPMASAGFRPDYVEKIHLSWAESEFGHGPTGTAIRTGKMSMCNNMFTDPAFEPWREQALEHGFASSIVFPLAIGDEVFGAISIYSKVLESFLDVEIKMLLELAGDLALGIANIRLRTAHKLAEKALGESHNHLGELVRERTHELQFTNDLLIKEINIRKQKEQNLKLTEEKYRTVADYNYDWETWLGPDGKYVYVSPSCESITGYSVDEFMKNSSLFFEITHPDDREMVESHASDSIKGIVDDCSKDFRIITKEGEERWIGHNCQPVYNAKGMFIGQRGSNRDITQRKKTERILIDSQRHLRELTQRMDIITEEERIRIAREIHDELGHLLTALKYDVESLINNTNLSEDLIKNELNGMISMIEALIDSVRKIATELRPGILDHLGLFPAIEWQISQFRLKNKINCEYAISEFDIDFDKNETTIIYRILQEIFTNITRHSKAKHVWVSIDKKDEYFILKVVDNGVGFVKNADSNTGSLGLMGMRERAMSIGGEIKIESELGKGTAIVFELKK